MPEYGRFFSNPYSCLEICEATFQNNIPCNFKTVLFIEQTDLLAVIILREVKQLLSLLNYLLLC
jgi:hypothetical protein